MRFKQLVTFTYTLFVIALCIAVGTLFFNKIPFNDRWISEHWPVFLGTEIISFLLIGLLHASLTHTTMATAYNAQNLSGVKNTLALGVLMAASLWILRDYLHLGFAYFTVAAIAAFLLPSCLVYSFNIFVNITSHPYKPWIKRDNLIDNKAFVFLSSISLRIKVAPYANTHAAKFPCTVPGHVEVGKIFHYFLISQQHNSQLIETEDERGKPFGWLFFKAKYGGIILSALDPDKSVLDNNITANTTLVAKRLVYDYRTKIHNHKNSLPNYELLQQSRAK